MVLFDSDVPCADLRPARAQCDLKRPPVLVRDISFFGEAQFLDVATNEIADRRVDEHGVLGDEEELFHELPALLSANYIVGDGNEMFRPFPDDIPLAAV